MTVSCWESRRLKYIASLNMGQSPPSNLVTRFNDLAGLPFLQGNAEFGDKYPSPKHTCDAPRKIAQAGDLLISVRAPVGALNVAEQAYGIGRGLCAITWHSLQPTYGWWSMQYNRSQLNKFAAGSTYEGVTTEDVASIKVSFPTKYNQKIIADYLDKEIAQIDSLISEKNQMLALLEEKRAALISQAVTRGLNPDVEFEPSGLDWLGEIPETWKVERFKFLIRDLMQGSSPQAASTPASDGEYGVLKLSAVSRGVFFREKNKALSKADGTFSELSLTGGDVLITRGNTPELVGDVCYVPSDEPNLLVPDLIYRIRVNHDLILPKFLTYFLITKKARVQIRRDSKGSSVSMVKISQEHINNWKIVIPPLKEQSQILMRIEKYLLEVSDIRQALESSIDLLRERRAALITAAVTGEIDVEEVAA